MDAQVIYSAGKSGHSSDPVIAGGIPRQAGPLDAELGSARGAHLDDQRLDIYLGAPRVELVDDGAQIAVDRLAGGDDQGIGRSVGLNESRRTAAWQRLLGRH